MIALLGVSDCSIGVSQFSSIICFCTVSALHPYNIFSLKNYNIAQIIPKNCPIIPAYSLNTYCSRNYSGIIDVYLIVVYKPAIFVLVLLAVLLWSPIILPYTTVFNNSSLCTIFVLYYCACELHMWRLYIGEEGALT